MTGVTRVTRSGLTGVTRVGGLQSVNCRSDKVDRKTRSRRVVKKGCREGDKVRADMQG